MLAVKGGRICVELLPGPTWKRHLRKPSSHFSELIVDFKFLPSCSGVLPGWRLAPRSQVVQEFEEGRRRD